MTESFMLILKLQFLFRLNESKVFKSISTWKGIFWLFWAQIFFLWWYKKVLNFLVWTEDKILALKFNRTRDHWFKSGQILIEMTTLGSDSSGHKLESNLSPVYRGVRFLHTLNWSLGSFLRVRGNLFYKWHLLKRDWNHWLDDHPNNMTLIPRTFLFYKITKSKGDWVPFSIPGQFVALEKCSHGKKFQSCCLSLKVIEKNFFSSSVQLLNAFFAG